MQIVSKIVSKFFYRSHRTYTSYHTPENSAVRASRSSNLSNSRRRVHRGAKRPQRSVDASSPFFYLKNEKKHKKAEKSFEFSPFACKLCFGIVFLTLRNPFPSSLHLVFQSKVHENRPSFVKNLLIPSTKYRQEHCVSVFAGRFSIVLGSGSWSDPRVLAWGSVRLFFVLKRQGFELAPPLSLPLPHSKIALNMFFGSITPYNPNNNQEKQNGNTN